MTIFKKNSLVSISFSLLLLINLVFVFIEGTAFGNPLRLPLYILNLMLTGVATIQYFIHESKTNIKVLFAVLILYVLYLVSISINGFKSGSLSVINIPITYFFLFAVLPSYKLPKRTFNIFLIVMIIWTILPIFIFFFGPAASKAYVFNESFCGFASHKNAYSSLAGVVAILILFNHSMNTRVRITLYLLICLGIFLTASRTGLFALLLSSLYFIFFSQKNKHNRKIIYFSIVFVVLFFVLFQIMSKYGTKINDKELTYADDRIELWQGFYDKWQQSPYWGQGEIYYYYSYNYPDGMPAHNFIMQTLCDFGLFVTLAYIVLLIIAWRKLSVYFRTFLLYIIIVGLFQPYFFFGSVVGFSLIALVLGVGSMSVYSKENVIEEFNLL